MNTPQKPVLAFLLPLIDRYFLGILLAGYVLAAVCPEPGLWIKETILCQFPLWGGLVRFSLPMLLLAALLGNAGLEAPLGQFGRLLRRPALLLVGLAANVLVPLAFILGVSRMMLLWHDQDEMQSILVGLAMVAAMPIAGSAAAWSRKANGNLALSLGLVVFSTLLSPLTTPIILHAVSHMTVADHKADLRALAGHATGTFLLVCVLIPSLLGMLTLRVAGEKRIAAVKPYLKLFNTAVLLLLIYTSAAASLPQALAHFAPQFFGAMLAVAVSFCIVAFAAGWLVARLLRADSAEQSSLMFGLGMSNNGTGMVLASAALAGRPQVLLLIVCYNLVQHLVAGGVDFIRQRQPVVVVLPAPFSWAPALRAVLSFGFLMAAGVVLTNAGAAYFNIHSLASSQRWVIHTHEVLTQLQELLSLLKDAETGQRGYLITGDLHYLEPYIKAVNQIHSRFRNLRELTLDNPDQKERTDELAGMIKERLAELELTIKLRREQGFEAARRVVLEDRGKKQMDEIRQLMAQMEADEQHLLEQRTADLDKRLAWTLATIVVASCLVLVYSFVRRLLEEHRRPVNPPTEGADQQPHNAKADGNSSARGSTASPTQSLPA